MKTKGDVQEFDVVVAGSGAGGLTVATVAAQCGLKVIVVEKAGCFGGTTAYSGGVAWIPGHHHMAAVGVNDDRASALEYLRNVLGNHYDAAKIEAYVDNGPKMLRYMEANTALEFVAVPTPDYEPHHPGASRYRGVLAREFDGRRLGAHLPLLRRTLPELTVFGSMQVAGADIVPLRKAFRTMSGFKHTAAMTLRYAWQRLVHGRGTRLVSGNALAARLLRSALDAGVELWKDAPAQELVLEKDRVAGLTVLQGGRAIELRARHGVVLATGGFGANAEMRRQFMPTPESHLSVQPAENVGDGIRMGTEVGAQVVTNNAANAIFIPVSAAPRKDGTLAKFPHIMIDRYMPGSILVDGRGKRFVNEADSYQNVVLTMHKHGLGKAYMVASRAFLRKYGMGLARPFPYPVRKWVRNGYLTEAPTIEALATRIGIDPVALRATVDRFNSHAVDGRDPDFARGADAHSRYRGDQENTPNPSLGPIGAGPYYAMTVYPGDLSSVAGLNTDEHARVLDADGAVVKGLYAVGLDMNSFTKGLYPAGGSSLGPAMTFGFIAARDIAQAARSSIIG